MEKTVKLFYLIQAIIFILLIRYLYQSLRSGVFNSSYGENLTVRKQEGRLGFYAIGIVYLAIIIWIGYLLITRREILF